MNLKEILSISGKPGLHKLVAQGRNGVIVESLSAGKRFPVMASQNVSSLADIAIYTYEDEISLAEILRRSTKKKKARPASVTKKARQQWKRTLRRSSPILTAKGCTSQT
jgi:uncharacterized iron-regulated protein